MHIIPKYPLLSTNNFNSNLLKKCVLFGEVLIESNTHKIEELQSQFQHQDFTHQCLFMLKIVDNQNNLDSNTLLNKFLQLLNCGFNKLVFKIDSEKSLKWFGIDKIGLSNNGDTSIELPAMQARQRVALEMKIGLFFDLVETSEGTFNKNFTPKSLVKHLSKYGTDIILNMSSYFQESNASFSQQFYSRLSTFTDVINDINFNQRDSSFPLRLLLDFGSYKVIREDILQFSRLGLTLIFDSSPTFDLVQHAFISLLEFHTQSNLIEQCKKDENRLIPTVVCDENGVALGMVWSNKESIALAIERREGIYYSRSRQEIQHKGSTSGSTQKLLRIGVDCDRDTLRFIVKQSGSGFCHNQQQRSCQGKDFGLGKLFRTLHERKLNPISNSYTNRLFNDSKLLEAKLREEVDELIEAKDPDHVAAEAADLIYFASVLCTRHDVNLSDIEKHLDRRSLRLTRRPGNAKPKYI